jgi:heat shock protein HspQ
MTIRTCKFQIGDIVRHRIYPFRGVIFDVDPVFDNTEEWWQSIPEEVRPRKDQPFYHLLAENEQTTYVAYVSEQNLVVDDSNAPISHPEIPNFFRGIEGGRYMPRDLQIN